MISRRIGKQFDHRYARRFARQHRAHLPDIRPGGAEIGKQDDHALPFTWISLANALPMSQQYLATGESACI